MSDTPEALPDDLYDRIVALTNEAQEWEEIEEWHKARAALEQALALLPEPKWKWEASTWIFTVLGDIEFQAGNYDPAREAFRQAMLGPGAIGNPFLHLRRGQTFFELGEMKWATDELAGAYMLEGKEIFEDQDPKYFEYLKTVLQPPVNGEW
jgi:tetratricopeptide (TPR) repeat protein